MNSRQRLVNQKMTLLLRGLSSLLVLWGKASSIKWLELVTSFEVQHFMDQCLRLTQKMEAVTALYKELQWHAHCTLLCLLLHHAVHFVHSPWRIWARNADVIQTNINTNSSCLLVTNCTHYHVLHQTHHFVHHCFIICSFQHCNSSEWQRFAVCS